MTLETVSTNKAFGGTQGVYRHESRETGSVGVSLKIKVVRGLEVAQQAAGPDARVALMSDGRLAVRPQIPRQRSASSLDPEDLPDLLHATPKGGTKPPESTTTSSTDTTTSTIPDDSTTTTSTPDGSTTTTTFDPSASTTTTTQPTSTTTTTARPRGATTTVP